MPSALILLAEGAEEMEAIITADVLRRGAVDVTIAGLTGPDPVTCSRQVVIKPDSSLDDVISKGYDIVICPGGLGGAERLSKSETVKTLLKKQESSGGRIACICAAPIALLSHGIGVGRTITSHPCVKDQLTGTYKYSEDRVVIDNNLITSRGPGTAFEFALAIVEQLQGKDKKDSIVPPMLLKL